MGPDANVVFTRRWATGTPNLTCVEPPHWANEYEPFRYCGKSAPPWCPDGLSLPAYAFFIRHTTGLTIDQMEVKYDMIEARPPFIIEDARNVSILRTPSQHAAGLGYDIGWRNTPLSEVRAPGLAVKALPAPPPIARVTDERW